MATDSQGVQFINIEGMLPTYSGSISYSPYANATDMVVLQNPVGSNMMIRVTNILMSGYCASGSTTQVYAYIRSALNTGGTAAAVTASKHDSNDAAYKAVMQSYSAAPTLNGTGTMVRTQYLIGWDNVNSIAGNLIEWSFADKGGSKAIHLRPGEQLSINNGANAIAAGLNLSVVIEWSESFGLSPVF